MVCVLQKCQRHGAFPFSVVIEFVSPLHYLSGFAGTEKSDWILYIFLVCHYFKYYELMVSAFS
jgi:hypothetical protein